MSEKQDGSSRKGVWIGAFCALAIAAAVGVMVWSNQKTGPSPADRFRTPDTATARSGPETIRQPIPKPAPETIAPSEKPDSAVKPSPVVDYDKLEKDDTLRALMEKRKERYGFEKGVDLIVKPDESIKVGDTVVPMHEILDRIRLKEGDLLEKDIRGSHVDAEEKSRILSSELETVEKRYRQLDRLIQERDPIQDKETSETYIKEREALEKIVTVHDAYKEILKRIEEKEKRLASLDRQEAEAAAPASAETSAAAVPDVSGRIVSPDPPAFALKAGSVHRLEEQPAEKASETGADPPAKAAEATGTVIDKPEQYPPANPARAERIDPISPGPQPDSPPATTAGDRVRERKPTPALDSLQKTLRQEINTLLLQKGDLESELLALLQKEKRPEAYGIYIVQPKDNIWNIHYKFLHEYFGNRGIALSRDADKPDSRGRSSGVGKILKFSEKMVYIFNIRKRHLTADIHLIHPLSKIVVFNMARVFDLLADVDYRDIDRIQFDGENIWLPAKG